MSLKNLNDAPGHRAAQFENPRSGLKTSSPDAKCSFDQFVNRTVIIVVVREHHYGSTKMLRLLHHSSHEGISMNL